VLVLNGAPLRRTIPTVDSANALELQYLAGADGRSAPVGDVTFTVPAGSSLAVLGPPQSGKTSLLRLIAGFGSTVGGRVLFNGHDLARVSPHKRPFSFLGSQDALFPHMNVAGNVAYGLKAQGLGRSESQRRVADALDLVGAAHLESAAPEALTRAERQKVALARSLAIEPLVLLLDEALTALDPLEAARVMTILSRLQRKVALTLIFSTTDGMAAMAQADAIAVLSAGRMIQWGEPGELYDRPDHAVTARLTGPVNLLAGRASRHGIEIAGLGDITAHGNVAQGNMAALALRPDRIDLHLKAPEGFAFEGEIERVAFSNLGLTAHIQLAGPGERIAARVDTRRLQSDDLPEGRRVWCTFAPDDARLVRV
jgi:ABC-type Fe3+/spermidine/putrescine transport system ATPase subunit